MKADIKGALQQLDRCWKWFEHNGNTMNKKDVKKVLEYGISKGYITTDQLTDEEIDNLLTNKQL